MPVWRFISLNSMLAMILVSTGVCYALPSGWQVVEGNVTFQQSGNTLNVTSTSGQAIVEYVTFSLANGETLNFILPNANASILNRVIGGGVSNIAGTMNSNGQIALVNTAGIQFANTAQIKTIGLLASTLNISNQDFLTNNNQLIRSADTEPASVINNGSIQISDGGYAILAGGSVKNNGSILAPDGSIHLAIGDKITFHLGDNISTTVTVDEGIRNVVDALNTGIVNNGVITGHNVELKAKLADHVMAQAISNTGLVQGTAMTEVGGKIAIISEGGENSITNSGILSAGAMAGSPLAGEIYIKGKNNHNTGQILAQGGQAQAGGRVSMLGDAISNEGALIDVSGDAGGGTILVGGDYQGQSGTYTATSNQADAHTIVKADVLTSGNGGKVIFWADDGTEVQGNISARGGNVFGDGGFVEVSGKKSLIFSGFADTRAAQGETGMLLLDPPTWTIRNGAGTDTGSVKYEQNLEAQSVGSNITLTANNDITLNNLSDNVLGLTNSLTLTSNNRDIIFNDLNDSIRTEGRNITLSAGRNMTIGNLNTRGASGTLITGNATLHADNNFSMSSGNIGGNLSIDTNNGGNIDLDNTDVVGTVNLQGGGGGSDITGNGNIFRSAATLDTNDDGGGNINLSADFRGNTTLYGALVNATDTAGDLTVTDAHVGLTNSTISANAANANADVAVSWIVNGAGKLTISANKNIRASATGGYVTTADTWVLNSTNGGDVTVDGIQLAAGTLGLTARTAAQTGPNDGLWIGTNGGKIILNNVRVDGATDIQAADTITGSGNTFNGTTNFDANLGTAYDINLTNSNFATGTNAFDGANVTASDTNALTVSSAKATGTGSFTATGAGNDLTISNANVSGNTTLTSGRNIAATNNNVFGTLTATGNGNIDIYETGSSINVNQITNSSATGTTTLYSNNGSVLGKGTAVPDIVSNGTGQVAVAAGTSAANTTSSVNMNINASGPVIAVATGRDASNRSIRLTGDINNSALVSGLDLNTFTFFPTTGDTILGDSTDMLNVTGTTTFSTANNRDVIGLGSFTGAVAGRIGLEVASGNFTSGGITAAGSTGWYGASDETMIIQTRNGDVLGSGYTTSGAGNMRLQAGAWNHLNAGNAINVNNVSAAQNLGLYATGANGGTSIRMGGTSSVAGHITATSINAANQFAPTTNGISLTASSGNLTTALLWSGAGNVDLTASNGSILQNTAIYAGSSTGVAGGKTIWASGPVTLTANGGANRYIDTGVMALTASGTGGNVTAKASGDSAGNGTGISVSLRGRADGNVWVSNPSNANTTGHVYLGTSTGASDTNLDDSPATVMDVMGSTTIRANGDVKTYGSLWGPVSIQGKSLTGKLDKGPANISQIVTNATTGTAINLAVIQGKITGGNLTSAGTSDIFIQAGSVLPRDKLININLTNVNAGGDLDVVVAGSTNGLSSGQSVVITGSKGGSSSATKPGGGAPLGTVSMP